MCTLAIAIERYIFVCRGVDAATILSRNRHLGFCITTSVLVVIVSVSEFLREFAFLKDSNNGAFPPSVMTTLRVSGILVFFVPAIICIVLYIRIGLTLKDMISNQDQNRRLNIAFAVTCTLWIVLWSPDAVLTLILNLTYAGFNVPNQYVLMYMQPIASYCVKSIYSSLNPIVFLLISPPFQAPILEKFKQIKTCMGLKVEEV